MKIRALCIFFPEMCIYKRYKYMKIWEKVSNIIKKCILNLYIMKNIYNFQKNSTQNEAFNVFIYQ